MILVWHCHKVDLVPLYMQYLVPIGPGLWQTNLSDSEPASLPEADLADEGVLLRDMQSDSKGTFPIHYYSV